jgi:hypothetical protein
MAPPTVATPTTIPSFFIIFLFKNLAMPWGVSVGGDTSDIELCEGANPDKWCEGVTLSGGEWVSVAARSDPGLGSAGNGGISGDPGIEKSES